MHNKYLSRRIHVQNNGRSEDLRRGPSWGLGPSACSNEFFKLMWNLSLWGSSWASGPFAVFSNCFQTYVKFSNMGFLLGPGPLCIFSCTFLHLYEICHHGALLGTRGPLHFFWIFVAYMKFCIMSLCEGTTFVDILKPNWFLDSC